MSGRIIRVVLVDDHPAVRRELSGFLRGFSDIEVVGEASDGRAAIELARRLAPDVMIMDVFMSGMNGIDATRAIRSENPRVRIVGLSMYDEAELGESVRLAGASTYVSKVAPPELLIEAVRGCQALRPAV
jgi:DNA-binding NarL/FixJ family response regulator